VDLITPGTSTAVAITISNTATALSAVVTITKSSAAAAAFFARASDIHSELTPANPIAVKHGNCFFGLSLGFHFNEGETFGTTGIPVFYQSYGGNFACLGKQRPQIVLGCGERQIPHEQFQFHLLLLLD
jgi:hypothetical protein